MATPTAQHTECRAAQPTQLGRPAHCVLQPDHVGPHWGPDPDGTYREWSR